MLKNIEANVSSALQYNLKIQKNLKKLPKNDLTLCNLSPVLELINKNLNQTCHNLKNLKCKKQVIKEEAETINCHFQHINDRLNYCLELRKKYNDKTFHISLAKKKNFSRMRQCKKNIL